MFKNCKIILLLFLGFIFSDCATLINGTSQTIVINSYPHGATVYVDSLEVGTTPLNVDLSRKDDHIVQIELSGYEKHFVVINSSTNSLSLFFLVPDFVLGFFPSFMITVLIYPDLIGNWVPEIKFVFFGSLLTIPYYDLYKGGMNKLTPETINITLQKSDSTSVK